MMHRYRVLHGILVLRQFTVPDLARFCEVKEPTVRTVLAREARFVERDGTRPEGRRGGQPIQYRLRADAEKDLTAVLGELELDDAGAKVAPLVADQEDPMILSLIAAEDVLLRQLPQAGPAERAGLVELADSDFKAVRPKRSSHRDVVTHHQVVDLLLRLATVEQAALAKASLTSPNVDTNAPGWPAQARDIVAAEEGKELDAIGRDLHGLLRSWPPLGDRDLLPDLVKRIGASWFGSVIFQAGPASR